jgi:hypothetical protein
MWGPANLPIQFVCELLISNTDRLTPRDQPFDRPEPSVRIALWSCISGYTSALLPCAAILRTVVIQASKSIQKMK